jgi:hypothetical protein
MKKISGIIILLVLLFKPLNSNAREFLNTYLHINFVFMYTLTAFGEIIDAEHDSYSIPDPSTDKGVTPDHHDEAYGISLDITPLPAFVLGLEEHAIKFGLRLGYRFHTLQQETVLEKNTYGGDLFTFRTLMFGPVIYYAPSIEASKIGRNYTASKGLVFYALFGKLSNGSLTAFPSRRDYGVDPVTTDYKTKVTGYKIDIGTGGEVSICGSVNIGLNLYYSRITLKMDSQVYNSSNDSFISKNVSKETVINEVCAEIYVGIPVQYW